jgi:hypothetical protein
LSKTKHFLNDQPDVAPKFQPIRQLKSRSVKVNTPVGSGHVFLFTTSTGVSVMGGCFFVNVDVLYRNRRIKNVEDYRALHDIPVNNTQVIYSIS